MIANNYRLLRQWPGVLGMDATPARGHVPATRKGVRVP
jgi:hypothetical protein